MLCAMVAQFRQVESARIPEGHGVGPTHATVDVAQHRRAAAKDVQRGVPVRVVVDRD